MNAIETLDGKYTVRPTGIEFNGELSFEEWEDIGRQAVPMAKSIGFIVGDWINYGEGRYGEQYTGAIESTGLDYGTLRNYAHVARRVEMSYRNDNLDFTHHMVVAKLKPDEQEHWLEIAAENHLGKRRLQRSINLGRLATDEEMAGDPADKGHVTYLALINRLLRWYKAETRKLPLDQWDTERREALKQDFGILKEIHDAL